MNGIFLFLHILSAVIWVGGMIFAHRFLRPVVAAELEPPQRLRLWLGVFSNFFPNVWGAIVLLPVTGYAMMFSIWPSMAVVPLHIHIMNGLAMVMILVFLHVYFAPFKKLKEAVVSQNWPAGGEAINQIRFSVGLNIVIGLIVILVASVGRYFV